MVKFGGVNLNVLRIAKQFEQCRHTRLVANDQNNVNAIVSAKRSPVLPDVSTAAESGLPGLEATIWFALAAPARTPPAIVAKVNRDVTSLLNEPDFRERWLSQAAETSPSTPDELAVLMRAEIAK